MTGMEKYSYRINSVMVETRLKPTYIIIDLRPTYGQERINT